MAHQSLAWYTEGFCLGHKGITRETRDFELWENECPQAVAGGLEEGQRSLDEFVRKR